MFTVGVEQQEEEAHQMSHLAGARCEICLMPIVRDFMFRTKTHDAHDDHTHTHLSLARLPLTAND